MNIYIAKCCVSGSKILCCLGKVLAVVVFIGWCLLLPVGLGLHLSGNNFGNVSLIFITVGSVPWGVLTFLGCVNGCEWLCKTAHATVEKEGAATVAPTPPQPEPSGQGQQKAEDPIENV